MSVGISWHYPQRSSVDFVWELPPVLLSPEVKLIKENNLANGISPNKINTLLAAGFYCRRRVTINIGIVFIPYVAFFESCRARKLV